MNKQNETRRYREQIGGCQRGGELGVGKMGKGGKKVQSSSYKIVSHGDVRYRQHGDCSQ